MLTQLAQPNPEKTPYEPILTLATNLDDLALKHHFRLDRGVDDLDTYQVAHLAMNVGVHFLLVHYEGMPKNTVELYVSPPARMQMDIAWRIVDALGVPRKLAYMRKGKDFE